METVRSAVKSGKGEIPERAVIGVGMSWLPWYRLIDLGTIVNATAFILTLFGPSFRRPLAQLATERASSPVRATPAICHLYQKADEPAF